MSIVSQPSQENVNFPFVENQVQEIQSVSKSYTSSENRIQPSIKNARANFTNSLPSNKIAFINPYQILKDCLTGAENVTGGVCTNRQYLFSVPQNIREQTRYNPQQMSRWCKWQAFRALQSGTQIGSFRISPNYNSVLALSEYDNDWGCYIEQWRTEQFRPRKKMPADRYLIP